jgi:ethanolamine utilization protein EutN
MTSRSDRERLVKVGRVIGNVVSTINHDFFDGERLLVCRLVDRDTDTGAYLICTDRVGAGADETVLILDEGSSARQIYGVDTGPIRSVVVGIVDDVHEML